MPKKDEVKSTSKGRGETKFTDKQKCLFFIHYKM
ncbi:Uncharacterised protein [Pasteurella canis]|uniref:Uncharacterized protein n=1 Tax=Pasteurella canis TaxID=753 RepID=A0A379EUL0_9PAST|nr:Uncharacterised protein [Pasteurella canis]